MKLLPDESCSISRVDKLHTITYVWKPNRPPKDNKRAVVAINVISITGSLSNLSKLMKTAEYIMLTEIKSAPRVTLRRKFQNYL